MNSVQNWGNAVSNSLADLWSRFLDFLPALIGAIIVFVIGLFIAEALKKITEKLVKVSKVGGIIDNSKFAQKVRESGMKMDFAKFIGELVKWFLILVFLMAATDILGLNQVTRFLDSILLYIPNILVAVIILSLSFIFADFTAKLVKSSTKIAKVGNVNFLAAVARWSIIIFGLLTALVQLGIAESLANTIFIGIIAAISLAFGLAFGLGGREEATLILRNIREKMSSRE